MRSDLPQNFVDELTKQGRRPIQLLVFYFDSRIVYVTDTDKVTTSDEIYYIVEDWGSLSSVTDLSKIGKGQNQPTKTYSISLLNYGENKFSEIFFDRNPLNVRVDLYQAFLVDGATHIKAPDCFPTNKPKVQTDWVLNDVFLVQDPIQYEESSGLLKLDLVSLNQYANPYIGQLDPVDNIFYPVVIGAVSKVPGQADPANPMASLAQHLDSTGETIVIADRDMLVAGFPESGTILLNFELISYTAIGGDDNNELTIDSRGLDVAGFSAAARHSIGDPITLYGHEYIYTFSQGPVDQAGPLYVDGELYDGPHTIYADRNPIQVGFPNRPPILQVDGAQPMESYQQELVSDDWTQDYWYVRQSSDEPCSSAGWINDDTGGEDPSVYVQGKYASYNRPGNTSLCTWYQYSTFMPGHNRVSDFSKLNQLDFYYHTQFVNEYDYDKCEDNIAAFPKFDVSGGWFNTGWQTHEQLEDVEEILTITDKTWAELYSSPQWLVLYDHQVQEDVSGEAGCRYGSKIYNYQLTVYYTWDAAVINDANITLDIGDPAAGPANPIDTIKWVFSKIGVGSFIDLVTFDAAAQWCADKGYGFSGLVPGDERCRDVLNDLCRQCRAAIYYNAGLIKIYMREDFTNKTPDGVFPESKVRLKSIKIAHQKITDIANFVSIRYDPASLNIDFQKSYSTSDENSIQKYGLHDYVFDAPLIIDDTMAIDLADHYLEELAEPDFYITFDAYMEFFSYEQGDIIEIVTDYANIHIFKGEIVNIVRRHGSGKNTSINLFTVTIRSNKFVPPIVFKSAEALSVLDGGVVESRPVLFLTGVEQANIADHGEFTKCVGDSCLGAWYDYDYIMKFMVCGR